MEANRRDRFIALLLNGLPGWILAVVGLSVAGLSLFADRLGIGGQPGIIGWKQLAGAATGGLLALGGGWILARTERHIRREAADSPLRFTVGFDPAMSVYDSAAPRIPFLHELAELFRYRYLLWNLVSRDLKVRYKRSALGFVWAMVNPLLTMIVMAAVFLNLFRVKVENYPIYLLAGLLLWRFFSGGSTTAMRSILGSVGIQKKIYVPASVFVAASVGSALVNLMFALVPLLLLAIAMGVAPKLTWLFLPIPILQVALLTFGIGLIVASLAVFFADVLDIYEVLISAYFYLTPIIYPISELPAFLARLEVLNPMHHPIYWFRAALLDGVLPDAGTGLAVSFAVLAITAAGWSIFTRLTDRFPYVA